MRGWDAYIKAEAMIKTLLTSLRVVTELQNPALRKRHWEELVASTKVRHLTTLACTHDS